MVDLLTITSGEYFALSGRNPKDYYYQQLIFTGEDDKSSLTNLLEISLPLILSNQAGGKTEAIVNYSVRVIPVGLERDIRSEGNQPWRIKNIVHATAIALIPKKHK